MVTPEQLKKWLEDSTLSITSLNVEGDGRHFSAHVVSPDFEGLGTLARHRMVYDALTGHVGTTLHALSLRTQTPNEL